MSPHQRDQITAAAQRAGLRLLVLFGSRARGDQHAGSDWDFAFLPGPSTTSDAELNLRAELASVVGTDALDLADLSRGTALLRHQVACDGKPIYQAEAEEFMNFQIQAATFWCDSEPVVRRAYEDVLKAAVQ